MKSIADIINHVLEVEGGKFTNDPYDSGGKTKWGWTERALRQMGWPGRVEDLDRATAFDLYYTRFVVRSGYAAILPVSDDIAAELVDTAVNMGEYHAGWFLQVALNAFNDGGKKYPDIKEDGVVGKATVKALEQFLSWRGAEGENVMLVALNSLQCARYIELAVSQPKGFRYVYGWIKNRVTLHGPSD